MITGRLVGRARGDRGTVPLEIAVLMPAVVALIALAFVVGRQSVAQGAVDLAAHDAARAASLSRTAAAAQSRANAAAQDTLGLQGQACAELTVVVDTSQFAQPVGQPASVSVTVACLVSYTDIAVPGMPTGRVVTSTFVSPLDQYRGRS